MREVSVLPECGRSELVVDPRVEGVSVVQGEPCTNQQYSRRETERDSERDKDRETDRESDREPDRE